MGGSQVDETHGLNEVVREVQHVNQSIGSKVLGVVVYEHAAGWLTHTIIIELHIRGLYSCTSVHKESSSPHLHNFSSTVQYMCIFLQKILP